MVSSNYYNIITTSMSSSKYYNVITILMFSSNIATLLQH